MTDNKTIKLYFNIENHNENIGKVILSNYIIEEKDFKNKVSYIETNKNDDIYYNNGIIYLKENVKYYLSFKSNKTIKDKDIFINIDSDVCTSKEYMKDKGVTKNISFAYYFYVGRTFTIIKYGTFEQIFNLEIRSSKMDYEDDYQQMITDLSKFSNSLLYNKSKSPLAQTFKIADKISESPFEYYLFLEYLFNKDNLPVNYEYVIHNMYSILKNDSERVPISIASNIDLTSLEEYVSDSLIYKNKNYSQFPKYIPLEVNEIVQEDKIDNPENQFFKYFLKLIRELVEELFKVFKTGYPYERLKEHKKTIDNYLSNRKLQDITQITSLPLNSQVLQKKQGYKKILQYYLELNNTYKLNWKELEEIIICDEKKISALYEKWCYFKLCEILSEITGQELTIEKVFKIDNYKLKDIKTDFKENILFKNFYVEEDKKVDIELGYNVLFKGKTENESYSVDLKPDYTIKVLFDDMIKYIHFDAKYKSDKIENENNQERSYNNEDIAKMHAYKDAIKNSIGAFILYPGTENDVFPQHDEFEYVGVGAFSLLPNKNFNYNKISDAINGILKEIVNNNI